MRSIHNLPSSSLAPVMNPEALHSGYNRILNTIYSPKHYCRRVQTFLQEYKAPPVHASLSGRHVLAFFRSIYRLGIIGRERMQYWKLLAWTLLRRPAQFPMAVAFAICGYYFRKTCEHHIASM